MVIALVEPKGSSSNGWFPVPRFAALEGLKLEQAE